MSKQCEIVQDLLPLYVDGACSEASSEMIKEHLCSCPSCNEIYQKMKSHTSEEALHREQEGVINRHKNKENQKILRYLFAAIAVLYLPALFIIPLFTDSSASIIAMPYEFILAVLFLYTFPCYMAFIELGTAVCRALDKQSVSAKEKALNIIGILLSVCIIATAFVLEELIFVYLTLAVLLITKWIISAVAFKKKLEFLRIFKQKVFWICVASLIVVSIVTIVISTMFLSVSNVREETLEVGYSIGVRESGSEYDGVYFDIGMEEQHSWDVIGKNPTMTVKWVNTTDQNVDYSLKCYIYKQTSDGWELCSASNIDLPEDTLTLPAGREQKQVYSIDGYDISESGLYKFVTFINEKAVWFEFQVTIEDTTILTQ